MNQAEIARARQELRTARSHTKQALTTVREMLTDPRVASSGWYDDLSHARYQLGEALGAGANADHRLALHAGLDEADDFTAKELSAGVEALAKHGITLATDDRVPEGVALAFDSATSSRNMRDLDRGRLWDAVITHNQGREPYDAIVTDGDGFVQVSLHRRVHLDTYHSIVKLHPFLPPRDLPLSVAGLTFDDVIAAHKAGVEEAYTHLTPDDPWIAHPPVEPVSIDELNAEITSLLQAIHDTHDITEAGTIHFGHTIYPGVRR